MKTKLNSKWTTIAFLLVMLCHPSVAVAGNATYAEQISSWWSGVKERVASVLGSFYGTPNAPAGAAPQSTVSSPKSADAPRSSSSNKTLDTPVVATTGAGTVETPLTRPRPLSIQVPVQIQPALSLRRHDVIVNVSSVPDFKPRPKKTVLALAPQAPLLPIKARAHFVAPLEAELAGKLGFTRTTVLVPVVRFSSEAIERLTDDTMVLLRGLFAWLLGRDDEALGVLHALAVKSLATPLARQKAMAFLAWALDDSGHQALASLAFWKSLAISPAGGEDSYSAAALGFLSAQSHSTRLAKVAADPGTLQMMLQRPRFTPEARSFLLLLSAERAYDHKAFALARKLAKDVAPGTSWHEQARYLAAIAAMAPAGAAHTEDVPALQTAGRELTTLFRTVENPDVFDATAVSLGRIHFILGNYKAAHKYLTQVSRDTNMYIEAAVDNAWALLRAGDRNHAVGNMFTLHTPYFEGAYMPESYFLQSLGYQEICQFGDAITSVKQFKVRYHDSYAKLMDFNANRKKSDQDYYDDLVSYLGHHDTKLSEIVLRELGRHPEFLRRQKELNRLTHEENSVTQRFPTNQLAMHEWLTPSITTLRTDYKREINGFLKIRALEMEDELKFLTANVSLLEYEIFAGAGQNLSLQGAQNFAIDDKALPSHKFEAGKEYWPYEDEIWEDELNHFRSKIVDGCAKVRKPAGTTDGAANTEVIGDEFAQNDVDDESDLVEQPPLTDQPALTSN